ncbi:MAG: hypothetical protein JWR19_2655 [Pedosphaera sp.]|nr:hypothetical protein [Pedosphaera sp.]
MMNDEKVRSAAASARVTAESGIFRIRSLNTDGHGREWTTWTTWTGEMARFARWFPLRRGFRRRQGYGGQDGGTRDAEACEGKRTVIMNNKVKQGSLRIRPGGRWVLRQVKVALRVDKVN